MNRAKYNERPTEVYIKVLRKEEASARALVAIRRTSPIYKAALWMGPENLGALHERESSNY